MSCFANNKPNTYLRLWRSRRVFFTAARPPPWRVEAPRTKGKRKKENRHQGRDGRTARRHHTRSVVLAVAHPNPRRLPLSISLRSPSPILAATFMPPRGRPTLVVLPPVASSPVASLSRLLFRISVPDFFFGCVPNPHRYTNNALTGRIQMFLCCVPTEHKQRCSLLQRMQRQHHVRGRADWRTCMPSHAEWGEWGPHPLGSIS